MITGWCKQKTFRCFYLRREIENIETNAATFINVGVVDGRLEGHDGRVERVSASFSRYQQKTRMIENKKYQKGLATADREGTNEHFRGSEDSPIGNLNSDME